MDKNIQKEKIRGSLIGGAIGDALGYPIEFIGSFEGIQKRYGEQGITRLDTRLCMEEPEWSGKAVVSDDTQMTLYTANGLLNAVKSSDKPNWLNGISMAYIEWYLIQIGRKSRKYNDCWINKIPELHKRRVPGMTCMNSIDALYRGREPQNDSKGCGGIMRIAPIPLYAAVDGRMTIVEAMKLSVKASEVTHQHPLGFLPSALESYIIYRLLEHESPSLTDFKGYIAEGYDTLLAIYPEYKEYISELKLLTDKAFAFAENEVANHININNIGGGWTAEETLAIAIYCAVKYYGDFEKAVVAAVNHGGDSDSTGAVLGNILGAVIGYSNIPKYFKDEVELHDVVLQMADDLCCGHLSEIIAADNNDLPNGLVECNDRKRCDITASANMKKRIQI